MERQKREEIAEAAGFWDARLRAPGCTDKDRQDFAAWRDANPAHREAIERLQSIVSTLRRERSRADLRAFRDAALAMANRRRKRVMWSVAASVSTLMLAALLVALGPQIAGFSWGQGDTFYTGTGQRSTVTLPDGSAVELNSETRIQVAFRAERRSVELLEGQAIFQVAKDPLRPFVVQAGDREIVAVGTAFDVRLDSSAVRVTLLEGKVAVTPQGGAAALELPMPVLPASERVDQHRTSAVSVTQRRERSETVYLSPGQQLMIARHVDEKASASARQLEVREIDVARVTSWRAGQVFFEDFGLAQAVAEMNKYSAVQISIEDDALEGLRINGMFRAGEQQAFARALEEYFPIVAERHSDTRIVLKARH